MEILYGVILLLTFILGIGIGISVPFFIKKYVKNLKEEKETEEIMNNNTKNVEYVPNDLLMEWMTGEEVKPNAKQ